MHLDRQYGAHYYAHESHEWCVSRVDWGLCPRTGLDESLRLGLSYDAVGWDEAAVSLVYCALRAPRCHLAVSARYTSASGSLLLRCVTCPILFLTECNLKCNDNAMQRQS
jgi:hypothetical protein